MNTQRTRRHAPLIATAILSIIVIANISPVQQAHAEELEKALDVDSTQPNRMILHYCDVDGTPIRPLISDVKLRHRFDRQGTPDVSADGKTVAFDAWASGPSFTWQESRIVVADIDGSNAKNISDGVMPSFSPSGTELAVSRPPKYAKEDGAKGMSIWTMKSDGTSKTMIADQGAWGARWSPDGKSLVFHGGVDENGDKVDKNCLRLFDFATKTTKTLFTSDQSPFSGLSYHFDWSKGKSRTVAIGGPLKDGNKAASAIMDVDAGFKSLRILPDARDGAQVLHGVSFDWHPNGDAVLVTGLVDGRPFPVVLDTTDNTNPAVFSGIPKNVGVRDPAYTPDGKHVIASFHSIPGR